MAFSPSLSLSSGYPLKPVLQIRRGRVPSLRTGRRLRAAVEEEVEEVIVVPPPEGVTQPKRLPDIPAGRFGFVEYAERLNSRVAMIGFVGILLVELFTNRGILQLAGLEIGSGLGFEI